MKEDDLRAVEQRYCSRSQWLRDPDVALLLAEVRRLRVLTGIYGWNDDTPSARERAAHRCDRVRELEATIDGLRTRLEFKVRENDALEQQLRLYDADANG